MKRLFIFLSFLYFLMLMAPTAGHSTVIMYTDRSSFESAILGDVLIDFEDPSLPRFYPALASYSVGEAIFTSSEGMFFSGPGRTIDWGSPSTVLGLENRGSLSISLNNGFTALGFEIGYLTSSAPPSNQVSLIGVTNVYNSLPTVHVSEFEGPTSTFYGWISDDEDILGLDLLFSDNFGYGAIDNVIYGLADLTPPEPIPPEPVSEPSTIFLLGSGLIGLLGFRRKFRK